MGAAIPVMEAVTAVTTGAVSLVSALRHKRPEHSPGEADCREYEQHEAMLRQMEEQMHKQAEQMLEHKRNLEAMREAEERAEQAHKGEVAELDAQRKKCEQEHDKELCRLQEDRNRVNAARAELTRKHQELQADIQKEWPKPAFFRGYEENVNVGFVGASGVGKSKLINRLLGSPQARVDVKECTQEPAPFSSGNITLWDLPGGNTVRFRRESYIKQMGLRYFDGLVIVTCTRFTQIDCELFREARVWKIPTFLVRTKADIDLENNQEDNNMPPALTLRDLKQNLRSHLASQSDTQVAREVDLFVLSTRSRKFSAELGPEFDGLVRALHNSVQKSRGGMPSGAQ